ncbi:hypothetical protein Tco_1181771 [Tanacetum coccineum]
MVIPSNSKTDRSQVAMTHDGAPLSVLLPRESTLPARHLAAVAVIYLMKLKTRNSVDDTRNHRLCDLKAGIEGVWNLWSIIDAPCWESSSFRDSNRGNRPLASILASLTLLTSPGGKEKRKLINQFSAATYLHPGYGAASLGMASFTGVTTPRERNKCAPGSCQLPHPDGTHDSLFKHCLLVHPDLQLRRR